MAVSHQHQRHLGQVADVDRHTAHVIGNGPLAPTPKDAANGEHTQA